MKKKEIIESGCIFTIKEIENGKYAGKIALVFEGYTSGLHEFERWVCDDETEAEDMIKAFVDPSRDPNREWNARHWEEIKGMLGF